MVNPHLDFAGMDPHAPRLYQCVEAGELISQCCFISELLTVLYPNKDVMNVLRFVAEGGKQLQDPRSDELAMKAVMAPFPEFDCKNFTDFDMFMAQAETSINEWRVRLGSLERELLSRVADIQADCNVLKQRFHLN